MPQIVKKIGSSKGLPISWAPVSDVVVCDKNKPIAIAFMKNNKPLFINNVLFLPVVKSKSAF